MTCQILLFEMLVLSLVAAMAAEAAVSVPFKGSFTGNDPLAGWTQSKDDGGIISVKDGWVTTDGPVPAHAHIELPLGVDHVTATVRLGAVGAMYVVWGPGDWIAIGKIAPTPFGRVTTVASIDSKAADQLHTGCFHTSGHYMKIEVGKTAIRFFYGPDTTDWRLVRVMERPASFQGAPQRLALGRAYTASSSPFSASPKAEGAPGPQGGSFSELSIERTSEASLDLTAAERKSLGQPYVDPVTRWFRSTDADPSFEAIVDKYPAYKFPREIVGVPEHQLAIGVDWFARLDNSPWNAPVGWFLVGEKQEPLVKDGQKLDRRLLNGWIPVVTLSTERDGVRWDMTAYGWSEGFSATADLYGYVELKASPNPGKVSLAYQGGTKEIAGESTGKGWVARFRYKHPEPQSATPVTEDEFSSKMAAAEKMWTARVEPAARFSVPDKRVTNGWKAQLAYSMLNSNLINGYVELHDGSGFYEDVFGYSMALHAMMADQFGMPKLTERLLATQFHFQADDGLYAQNAGLPDHGSLLLAVAHHYQVTRDKEWLKKVAPSTIKACEWVMRQRASAPQEGLTRGLIKFRPYCDYLESVYSYLGNSYCCIGLEQCAQALAEIGASEAAAYAAEGRRYRQDILASMDAAVIERNGVKMLPIEPDTHRLLKDSNYKGGDYYGLVAGCLLESDFLTPADPRTLLLTDALENHGGLIAGLCEFMEGIDHAYTFGYLLNKIRRDQVREALLGFWGMFAFGMVHDTFSPVEVHMIATGENHLTLPHSYSVTQHLRLLRSMLVLEEGDSLWLARATPSDWLKPGKAIEAKDAPTTFGAVSYRIEGGDGSAEVRISTRFHHAPRRLMLRLREPGGRRIADISPARGNVAFRGDVVEIASPGGDLRFKVRFEDR